jgi:hypothetical protein
MDDFEYEWSWSVYGQDGEYYDHYCAAPNEEPTKCVDCAKYVSCWNVYLEMEGYNLCDDCLAIDDTLEMNQIPRGEEVGEYEDAYESEPLSETLDKLDDVIRQIAQHPSFQKRKETAEEPNEDEFD